MEDVIQILRLTIQILIMFAILPTIRFIVQKLYRLIRIIDHKYKDIDK